MTDPTRQHVNMTFDPKLAYVLDAAGATALPTKYDIDTPDGTRPVVLTAVGRPLAALHMPHEVNNTITSREIAVGFIAELMLAGEAAGWGNMTALVDQELAQARVSARGAGHDHSGTPFEEQ